MAIISRRTPRIVFIVGGVLFVWLLLRLTSSSSSGPRPIKAGAPRFVESSVDFSKAKIFHAPGKIKPLPTSRPKQQRKVQAPASAFAHHSATTETRRQAVRAAFQRSWQSYRKYAWLRDEVEPVTRGARDTFGGWGATLVDSLDTLWIMDLKTEFREAVAAAVTLDWAVTDQTALNVFETTIRHLGGLLSAYDLSGDGTLLDKAHELGELLYAGFDTPNRLPGFWLNFEQARTGKQLASTADAAASPASLSIEMTRLSQLTGDPKFYDAADRVTQFLERTQNETQLPGMWPMTLNYREETAPDNRFSLGALADSMYEYLPKMHALMGGVDERYKSMYETAMAVVVDKMLFRPMTPDQSDILFTGDFHAGNSRELIHESQHLTCFVGGMFGLGGRLFDIAEHVEIGTKLARGCGWAYSQFPSGIMPEIFNLLPCKRMDLCIWEQAYWDKNGDENLPKGFVNARDARYLLRPEAIESIFVMYRITGKQEFQDMAWDMFEAIMRVTKTDIANTAVSDVREKSGGRQMNSMESFWTAETLKYFYLIFSPPDVISLDEYVFNTEAHPMRRPGTQIKKSK